jgi:hypothetical protein
MADNEFQFSLISENDIKANEEILKKRIEDTLRHVDELTLLIDDVKNKETVLNNKISKIREHVMPLLQNLSEEPDKDYIHWENRVPQVNYFIKKLNEIIEE